MANTRAFTPGKTLLFTSYIFEGDARERFPSNNRGQISSASQRPMSRARTYDPLTGTVKNRSVPLPPTARERLEYNHCDSLDLRTRSRDSRSSTYRYRQAMFEDRNTWHFRRDENSLKPPPLLFSDIPTPRYPKRRVTKFALHNMLASTNP